MLLVSLFLAHKVGRSLNKVNGGGDGDYDSYKRWPHGGFASVWDDLVFSLFVRVLSGLNGDISILA